MVITRAADQAESTARLVASFEAIPVVVPLIEVVDEPTGMAELMALELGGFDWVVVTSPNGAHRVTPRLMSQTATPRLAAVGSATASALPRCDLVAGTQSALGLLERFPHGPGRVVVVQAVDAASALVEGLLDSGWDVVAVSPYRTVQATPSAERQLAALAADAVLFASGSAARAWVEVFGTVAPPVVVAIGEQTAAAAERAGLIVSAVAAEHSIPGMLIALNAYFSVAN